MPMGGALSESRHDLKRDSQSQSEFSKIKILRFSTKNYNFTVTLYRAIDFELLKIESFHFGIFF